jgi:hypothetical protein
MELFGIHNGLCDGVRDKIHFLDMTLRGLLREA